MNEQKAQMIKLGALWNPRNGGQVLTGSINGDVRIVVMPNRYKKEDKHPDWILYLAPNEKKDGPRKPVSPDSINPEDIGF